MAEQPELQSPRRHARWVVAAVVVVVLGAVVTMYLLRTPTWFGIDDWDPLATRSAFDLGDLLRSHAGHPTITPTLVYRALLTVFGLDSTAWHLLTISLHVAVAGIVVLTTRRAGVRWSIVAPAATMLLFFGSGYENITYTFGMTFAGSLAFGLAGVLAFADSGRWSRRDTLGIASCAMALTFSSVGVTTAAIAIIALALRKRWAVACTVAGVLGGGYVAWLVAVEQPATPPLVITSALHLAVAHVVDTFWMLGQHLVVVIPLVALAVLGLTSIVTSIRRGTLRPELHVTVAMAIGAIFFLVSTGLARSEAPFFNSPWPISRYLHITAVLLLPLIAHGAETVAHRVPRSIPLIAVVFLAGIPSNLLHLRDLRDGFAPYFDAVEHELQVAPRLPELDGVPNAAPVEAQLAPGVTMGWLREQLAAGRLPQPKDLPRAELDAIIVRVALQSRLSNPGEIDRHTMFCRTVADRLEIQLRTGDRLVLFDSSISVTLANGASPATATQFRAHENAPTVLDAFTGPLDLAIAPMADTPLATVCRLP